MPYRLKQGVSEPLSRKALQDLRDGVEAVTPYVLPDRFERLASEIKRYCRGEQDGRSFLISGHRGSGKTTLSKVVLQTVLDWAASDGEALIPLPVLLHGPTLLSDTGADNRPANTKVNDKEKAAKVNDKEEAAKEYALSQIILSLYTSLSDAIVTAWEHTAATARPGHYSASVLRELLELKSHLDLRLQRAPEAEVLRGHWARAGLLDSGVAFNLVGRRSPPRVAGRGQSNDQGVREIVALASCADVYRALVGTTRETWGSIRKQQQEQSTLDRQTKGDSPPAEKDSGNGKGKSLGGELAPAALGVGSGAGAAFLLTDVWQALAAVLIGAGVWVASKRTFERTLSRKEERASSREVSTEVSWSAARFERELPYLLRRIKDAGFAPIFVLDELDKVRDLENRMNRFLNVCKNNVTDQAIFFFLTNRDYYEQINLEDREGLGRSISTFFAHKIFVTFFPEDFRRFVVRAMTPVNMGEANDVTARRNLYVWGTILAYRSRMSPFALRRQLNALFGGEFRDTLPADPLSFGGLYLQEVTMQLGIEMLLRRADIAGRIQQDDAALQRIYDTLYFLPLQHGPGRPGLGPHDVSEDVLARYLIKRVTEIGIDEDMDLDDDKILPLDDRRFFKDLLDSYIDLLMQPEEIRRSVRAYANTRSDVQDRQMWAHIADTIRSEPLIVEVDVPPAVAAA